MKIQCPKCLYEKDVPNIPSGAVRAKCPKCGIGFEITAQKSTSPSAEVQPQNPAFQKKTLPESQTSLWYYDANGTRNGPVGEDKIKELIDVGVLKYGAHVWKKDFPDWMVIENTPLKSYLKCPPPLTGVMVSNTTVWVLAFAPLIGLFLKYFLWGFVSAMLYGGVYPYHNQLFFITPILNIALSITDERKLKKAGHDTSKMGMAWLVPVYLFKRSKILKQDISYFIVWIVCFVLILFA